MQLQQMVWENNSCPSSGNVSQRNQQTYSEEDLMSLSSDPSVLQAFTNDEFFYMVSQKMKAHRHQESCQENFSRKREEKSSSKLTDD